MNVTLNKNNLFKSVTLTLDGEVASEFNYNRSIKTAYIDLVPVTVNFGENPLLEERVKNLEDKNFATEDYVLDNYGDFNYDFKTEIENGLS